MKLKLDENLGERGAEFLRSAGHDVTTVYEQQLTSADDATLIRTCAVEKRCLVTLDIDFANPFVFKPSDYTGIAVLRLPSKITPRNLFDAIRTLIAHFEGAEVEGKLWIVETGRIREYRPDSVDELS